MPKQTQKKTLKTAKCEICGATLSYSGTGAVPKRCTKCKELVKQATSKPGKREKWSSQRKASEILEAMFPGCDFIRDGFYSWLKSPKGQFLQLDWYCPELKLAAEYEGIQHYQYVRHFHRTRGDFDYLQACDRIKTRVCEERGITLLQIKYDRVLTIEWLLQEVLEKRPDLAPQIAAAVLPRK